MTDEHANALFDGLREAFKRREWGDITALSLAATYPDDDGNFEIAVLDHFGEPVFTPSKVNVLDPEGERQTMLSLVYEYYLEWQTDPKDGRDSLHRNQWKTVKDRLDQARADESA